MCGMKPQKLKYMISLEKKRKKNNYQKQSLGKYLKLRNEESKWKRIKQFDNK